MESLGGFFWLKRGKGQCQIDKFCKGANGEVKTVVRKLLYKKTTTNLPRDNNLEGVFRK